MCMYVCVYKKEHRISFPVKSLKLNNESAHARHIFVFIQPGIEYDEYM